MKLLFIYGSPAVGKLTVAKEIAKQTDFKVFHNHLTVDAVEPIFEFGTVPFWNLVDKFRIETFKEAIKSDVNLIFTFCYAKDFDDAFVANLRNTFETNGGEVCNVFLKAEKSEIKKRLVDESRIEYGKVKSIELLENIWNKNNYFSPINTADDLIIDNTNLPANKTANNIIEHFQLQRK